MSGSGISRAALGSALSTRVRTGGSSGSALLVSSELFSELSILVRRSEMFMAVAFKWGRRMMLPARSLGKIRQLRLVNGGRETPDGPNGWEEED